MERTPFIIKSRPTATSQDDHKPQPLVIQINKEKGPIAPLRILALPAAASDPAAVALGSNSGGNKVAQQRRWGRTVVALRSRSSSGGVAVVVTEVSESCSGSVKVQQHWRQGHATGALGSHSSGRVAEEGVSATVGQKRRKKGKKEKKENGNGLQIREALQLHLDFRRHLHEQLEDLKKPQVYLEMLCDRFRV
ncbi:hypothetical protein Fmac_032643 [Flemingia macrophylla]|uniref:Uncharacterized protein n=1 Tax=Flemingia macrophylla TaxID=520843 RepID=A0ABD1L5H8_9FABA